MTSFTKIRNISNILIKKRYHCRLLITILVFWEHQEFLVSKLLHILKIYMIYQFDISQSTLICFFFLFLNILKNNRWFFVLVWKHCFMATCLFKVIQIGLKKGRSCNYNYPSAFFLLPRCCFREKWHSKYFSFRVRITSTADKVARCPVAEFVYFSNITR